MTPEQIQRTIDFILRSQADSAARMEALERSQRRLQDRQEKFQEQLAASHDHFQAQDERIQSQIDGLAEVSLNLVHVLRLTTSRLDRLEQG